MKSIQRIGKNGICSDNYIFYCLVEVFYEFAIYDNLIQPSLTYTAMPLYKIGNFIIFMYKKVTIVLYLASLVIFLKRNRKKKSRIRKNLYDHCLICGTRNQEMRNWEDHIQNVHNLKIYLDFLIYIYEKEENQRNYIEEIIYQKIINKDNSVLNMFY